MFLLLFYILHKPNIKLIRNPDIILSPGGLLGFYVLGICHFIKNNYDLSGKKIIGFSAGSLNTIFLSLDKQYDSIFLRQLFQLNLNGIMPLPTLLNKTIKLINKMNMNMKQFDTTNKYIAVTTNYNNLEGYNKFLSVSDMTKCCISSSFIPIVTFIDIFYLYNDKCSLDG